MQNIGYNRFFVIGTWEEIERFIETARGPRPPLPNSKREAIKIERMRFEGKNENKIHTWIAEQRQFLVAKYTQPWNVSPFWFRSDPSAEWERNSIKSEMEKKICYDIPNET